MPIKVSLEKGKLGFIYPIKEWKTTKTKIKSKSDFKVDENFYVNLKLVD